MIEPDLVVRAMTLDGAFRIVACVATDTVRGALTAQGTSGDVTARLAELITSAILVRETTQPGRRVQILWRDRRGGTLVADSLPDGSTRGIVNPGEPTAVETAGDHLLQVNYTLPHGALHQGTVAVAEGDDMATALMRYMHESEQSVTMIAIAAIEGPGGVRAVGGYLVQLLPEATREVIDAMADRVAGLEPISTMLEGRGRTARELVATVFEGFDHQELASSELRFGCTCSEVRVMQSLLSLGDAEVAELIAGDPLEVRCDACGQKYVIDPALLRGYRDSRNAEPS